MPTQSGILRGRLARKTGCNLETIRYYEKVGLLPAPPRSANGYRVYPPELVERLQFIMRARDLGFTMEQIRSLLSLTDNNAQTCAGIMAKARAHLLDVRLRITDLQRIEQTLSQTLSKCTGDHVPECAILGVLQQPAG
jgi:MerR family mercuric resistance operon transcriptional regulator